MAHNKKNYLYACIKETPAHDCFRQCEYCEMLKNMAHFGTYVVKFKCLLFPSSVKTSQWTRRERESKRKWHQIRAIGNVVVVVGNHKLLSYIKIALKKKKQLTINYNVRFTHRHLCTEFIYSTTFLAYIHRYTCFSHDDLHKFSLSVVFLLLESLSSEHARLKIASC